MLISESEVILRQADLFVDKVVFFAGAIRDTLPTSLACKKSYVHTVYFDFYRMLHPHLGERVTFGLLPQVEHISQCDCLIYYWPKNKAEAEFQLKSLLSQLPLHTPCYIVGENRSGVRSVVTLLQDKGVINKIDSARRCSCYYFDYAQVIHFDLADYWSQYRSLSQSIVTLPGVFSANHLDEGSALLLSVLLKQLPADYTGALLDIGCGAGVLGSELLQHAPKMQLTLSDVHAAALTATEATLQRNGQQADVVASNLFSEITGQFDIICTNPPFHEGRQINLGLAERLFRDSLSYLRHNGICYIVANAFLPYAKILQIYFGNYEIVASNNKFKVYRVVKPATLTHLKQ